MTLALCVGVFSLQTRHSHSWWLPLHTMQLEIGGDREFCCGLTILLCCVFAAKAIFDLLTELLVSSFITSNAVFFIKSCASGFSFSQLLKSRRVDFTQCFLTVKSDHDSFILGGSFCTTVLRSAALFESVNDVVAIVHLQWWKAAEFVEMGTYDRLWLAKLTFQMSSVRLCTLRRSKRTQL